MQTTTEKKKNGAPPTIVDVDDVTKIAIIAVYLVQKLGQPTMKEIQAKALEQLSCRIDGRNLRRALTGASRAGRNLISVLQGRAPGSEGGAVRDVYSMKDPQRWKSPPEMAHINELLPKLLATPELEEVKGWFDDQERTKDPKAVKAQRGNDVDAYHNFSVLIYTTDTLLGSQIHCPYTDMARGIVTKPKEGKKDDDDDKPTMEGIFVVDELTGDRILPPDVMNGWWTTNAGRYGGMQDARGLYVAFKPVHIPKRIQPIQLMLPVNNSKSGASAPKSYEAIPAGQILKIEFTAPTKGLYSPEQYEKLFHIAGNRPRRGFSPARGKRHGHFVVIGFRDLGPLKESGIEYVLDGLPPALAKFGKAKPRPEDELPTELTQEHHDYLVDAVKRLEKVAIKVMAKAEPSEPFPQGTSPASATPEDDED